MAQNVENWGLNILQNWGEKKNKKNQLVYKSAKVFLWDIIEQVFPAKCTATI
jgi:hypothetical protein